MDRLSPGLFGQKEMVVEEQHLASVWGNLGVEVLSTHFVVLLMEVASRDAVERLDTFRVGFLREARAQGRDRGRLPDACRQRVLRALAPRDLSRRGRLVSTARAPLPQPRCGGRNR